MNHLNWLKKRLSRLYWRLEHSIGFPDLDQMKIEGRVEIGTKSYGEPRILAYGHDATRLIIGNYTSIARDATFVLGGNHRIDTVTTFPLAIQFGLPQAGRDGQPWSRGDIRLGSDVWIAAKALVLSGVQVGDGAVVAAGSIVTRDVRPFAVVAGNPATEVRRRFSDTQCEALQRIAWWDWDESRVRQAVAYLSATDIDAFIGRYSEL